jgi:long-chain fatty acid transport protein
MVRGLFESTRIVGSRRIPRTADAEIKHRLDSRRELDMKYRLGLIAFGVALALTCGVRMAGAQGYGTDLQNLLAPASGGMAGVSTARPQDVPSAIFGNPATMAQFCGTQFSIGGGWLEGYPTVSNDGLFSNNGDPFSITSRTQGFVIPEIGVTQDLRPLGYCGTLGIGLSGLSGAGAEYRGLAPESAILNNLSSEYLVLGLNFGAGFQVTDRLAVGVAATLGVGFEELGQVGPIVSSAMVNSYGLRGTVGTTYELNDCNTLGFYYQSKLNFTFPNSVRVGANFQDIKVDQPDTFGLGIANRSLLGGNLLIAADVYYKVWQQADLWQDVFLNQWAFAVGTQLTQGKMKYRLGYAYNSNPINHSVGDNLDGIGIGRDFVQLYQAASVPLVNQHRITGGIGRQDLLMPGLDLDLFAGCLPHATDQFGDHTSASLGMYYLGLGFTWRYDASKHECDNSIVE